MADEYGVTPTGFVKKRLDIITNELHTELSATLGFNTNLNKQSFLNVLVTSFADKIAELWEVAEADYHAMYPASASDASLDNAAQYTGTVRERAARSYYPIHCTGTDGTTLEAGTVITSNTNPVVNFLLLKSAQLSRANCNKAAVRVATVQNNTAYTIAVNGMLYSYTSDNSATEEEILAGLAAAVTGDDFTASVTDGHVLMEAADAQSQNAIVLTENLTTTYVVCIVNFASEEYDDVYLPNRTITNIVKAAPGLKSVTNLSGYIAGRKKQSDVELRASYAAKIFSLSARMLESIESAIIKNVQGVTSVKAYENFTDEVDADGRYPHSIEVVCAGGDSTEIAKQIIETKAAGINTYGSTAISVPCDDGVEVTVRFNRPSNVYCWFRVAVTIATGQSLSTDYVSVIKTIICNAIDALNVGDDVMPQRFIAAIYANIAGVGYVDITMFSNADSEAELPITYTERMLIITKRQLAVTSAMRIEVTLNE